MTASFEYQGNLRTECVHLKSGSIIQTDAPVDNKGKGMLFSPTDLLASSLVTCMITVMAIKAQELGIAFNHVKADMNKIMSSNPRKVKEIQIKILIRETWSDKEKEILEEVGRNCPVALSLSPDLNQQIDFVYSLD